MTATIGIAILIVGNVVALAAAVLRERLATTASDQAAIAIGAIVLIGIASYVGLTLVGLAAGTAFGAALISMLTAAPIVMVKGPKDRER